MSSLALGAAAAVLGSKYLSARLGLEHDLIFAKIVGGTLLNITLAVRAGKLNFFYILEHHALAKSTANKPFILFEDKSYTYAETYEIVLRYGTWLKKHKGVNQGDIVALDYQNSAMFMFLWFGLWSIGARPAFINYQLQGDALAHCMRESTAKLALVDPLVEGNLSSDVREKIPGVNFVVVTEDVQIEVESVEAVRYPDELRRENNYVGTAILIYTSGTTGLPKAAIISWAKVFIGSGLAAVGTGMGKDDVFYTVSSHAIIAPCQ